MTLTTAIDWPGSVLMQLANPAVRGIALAACAGVALTAFRVKATSLRLFTWTAVLYGALALPLVGWIMPTLSVPLPGFLQRAAWQTNQVQEPQAPAKATPSRTKNTVVYHEGAGFAAGANTIQPSLGRSDRPLSTPPPVAGTPATCSSHSSVWLSIQWSTLALAIYFAVAVFLLVRFVIGLVMARKLMRSSQTIDDPRVVRRLASRAYACGLRFVPRAAESELISVPVTVGARRSAILLPAGWREWDSAKLDAVVAHEISHVTRHDALTQRLALLHRAIFWFSPLAWWLDRHLADLAEQASDEAALSGGANRNDYARTLLGFFEALHAAPGRVWWHGVSMAKIGQAEQRLERILAWRGAVAMGLKKSVAVAIVALAIPAVYLAASVRPADHSPHIRMERAQQPAPAAAEVGAQADAVAAPAAANVQSEAQAAPPADPVIAPAPAAHAVPVAGVASAGPASMAPTGAPSAPVAPISPPAALGRHSHSSGHGYSYAFGYDDEERFVIVSGKSDSLTMSGSSQDARHVEKLRKQIPGDFIWFQRDEKSYIIRDQATIDRARKLWEPQEELGKQQEELGKQQEVLGKQQEALGAKMEQIQVKVPDMTAELDKLRAELKALSAGATVEQVGRIQSEIGELQSKIGEVQSHAGDQQGKLGEEMGALGEKQGKLGEQQGELGRRQAELAEQATRQMKVLFDEAIKNGKAQPEPGTGGSASL